MTVVWFVVFAIATLIGEPESLHFTPLNGWAWLFLFAIAIDLWNPER